MLTQYTKWVYGHLAQTSENSMSEQQVKEFLTVDHKNAKKSEDMMMEKEELSDFFFNVLRNVREMKPEETTVTKVQTEDENTENHPEP